MTFIITFLDNSGKGLYFNLESIGYPTNLISSGQRSHHFGTSSSTNNYTSTLHPPLTDTRIRKKVIWKWCGIFGHKDYHYIICRPKLLPTSIRIKINYINNIYGNEPIKTPRYWNNQPPLVYFKSRTSPPKTTPVVLDIMWRLNHHTIDTGDVEVYPSEYLFESTPESVPD